MFDILLSLFEEILSIIPAAIPDKEERMVKMSNRMQRRTEKIRLRHERRMERIENKHIRKGGTPGGENQENHV